MAMQRWFLLVLAAVAGNATSEPTSVVTPASAAVAAAVPAAAREALLEVTINGEPQKSWSLVEVTPDGVPWVRRRDLQTWGIRLAPESPVARLADDALTRLNDIPGVQGTVDRPRSLLQVQVQPALLETHVIRAGITAPRPTPSPLAAFVNYDLGAAQSGGPAFLRAATETGVVYGAWVARSSWLTTSAAGTTSNLRLDSNVTADDPAGRTSLQWGDTFARLGSNGESVRIGGVSWGTDFSVTPSFITVPLPTVSNVSGTTGAVDLYVNGARTQQLNVPGGPFIIAQVPVTTGAGELTVVTHDLLGRTQTTTQSYYVSPQMLRAGLSSWDVQLGSKRLDYGFASDRYAGWIAAGGERFGLTDRLTAQWRLEADDTGAAASTQWLALTPDDSLITLGPYCSAAGGHAGCSFDAGYEHDRRLMGYGLDFNYATPGFAPIAAAERTIAPRWQLVAHAQASVARNMSFAVGNSWREFDSGAHSLAWNVSAAKTFLGAGQIDLSVNRISGAVRSSSVVLTYTQAIGRRSVGAEAYTNDGSRGTAVTLQQNAPAGNGYGYQLRASRDTVTGAQAAAQWNGDSVMISGLAQHQGDHGSVNADVAGAALWVGDDLLLARHLDQSFAIVHAAGLGGSAVYLNEQPVSHVDARGEAVIPGLRPYEANKVALDLATLPLALDVSQQTFDVIPYRRGGAVVDFAVALSATVRLTLADGTPVPAGARISTGGRATLPVGADGLATVKGVAGENVLEIRWSEGRCRASLALPVEDDPGRSDVVELSCAS